MEPTFNGGKLYHTHELVGGDKPRSLVYVDKFTSADALVALRAGVKQLKVDGECSALHREDGEWAFYRRQDNYSGAEKTLDIAEGKQSAHYNQGGKEHNYSWLRASPQWTTGKGKRASSPGPDTYAAIKLAVEQGHLPDPTQDDCPEWITCEWVGIKHQNNMDGVPYEHALVPHMEPFVPNLKLKSLQEFHDMVRKECFEGIVIVHPNGTRFKLRSDTTGPGSLWEQYYRKKGGVTTIRPQVLTKDGLLVWRDGEWIEKP